MQILSLVNYNREDTLYTLNVTYVYAGAVNCITTVQLIAAKQIKHENHATVFVSINNNEAQSWRNKGQYELESCMGTDFCTHSRTSLQLSSPSPPLSPDKFQYRPCPHSNHPHPHPSPQTTVPMPIPMVVNDRKLKIQFAANYLNIDLTGLLKKLHAYIYEKIRRVSEKNSSVMSILVIFSLHLHFCTHAFIVCYIPSLPPQPRHKRRHRSRGTTVNAVPIPAITAMFVIKFNPITTAVPPLPWQYRRPHPHATL